MRKKLIILLVLLLTLSGAGYAGYAALIASNQTVIRQDLSDRSEEFLKSQAGDTNSELGRVNLQKKRFSEDNPNANRIMLAKCYSLLMPFMVQDSRTNEPCVYYAILESPRGSLTTSLREVGFGRVEEAPDVTFRRGKKEQYKEEAISVNSVRYVVFTDIQSGMEKTAFGMLQGKLFTLSMQIAAADDVQTRQLRKILESLELE